MKIFLISGKAGSGKNEVANILKKELKNAVITGFSKYIKLFALEYTDWDGRDLTKPREFLQTMGDELRKINQNFLTNRLLEDFKVYERTFSYVIISDVRLIYELEYIKKNSPYSIITIRVNASESKRDLKDKEKNHHTEIELDDYKKFDYILENKFDETLESQVKEIVERER